LAILERHSSKPKTKKKILKPKTSHQSGGQRWHEKLDSRPIYGDPIDFRGLRHEPVNEQGVVFLFGMVSRELGFLVEAIQGGFPDCEAKRQVSRGQWQPVKIEFEYASKNFYEHGHDPKNCDVIVCWIHNWVECPGDIPVPGFFLPGELRRTRSFMACRSIPNPGTKVGCPNNYFIFKLCGLFTMSGIEHNTFLVTILCHEIQDELRFLNRLPGVRVTPGAPLLTNNINILTMAYRLHRKPII